MKKEKKITSCSDCPFFEVDGGMEKTPYCGHPYWKDNGYGFEEAALDTEDYKSETPPSKCPLRKSDLTIEYSLV